MNKLPDRVRFETVVKRFSPEDAATLERLAKAKRLPGALFQGTSVFLSYEDAESALRGLRARTGATA